MSNTNTTLPLSAISSVGYSSTDVCYPQACRLASVQTQEGLPAEKTLTLKSVRNSSESQISLLRD